MIGSVSDDRNGRARSADRLREMLALSGDPLRLYTTEALYRVQVDYTCQLLDAVDEVTDSVTAGLITEAIYERLTGDGVSAAAERIREARAGLERLMNEPPQPLRFPGGLIRRSRR